jgi:hypothetical protein
MAYLGTKPANQVIDSTLIADGTVTPSDLSTGKPYWDTSGNLGVGTTSPSYKLDVNTVGGSQATARLVGNDQSNCRLRIENNGSGGRTWELIGGFAGANNSNFSIYDVTGSATRMTIDSSGRVTTPNQPAFRAGRDAGNVTGGATIVFNSVDFNIGSHYNSSTGSFTAPVAGRYMFLSNMFSGSGASPYVAIRVNGSNKSWTIYSGGGYGNVSLCTTLNLAANDSVTVYVETAQVYAAGSVNDCVFCGYLLG